MRGREHGTRGRGGGELLKGRMVVKAETIRGDPDLVFVLRAMLVLLKNAQGRHGAKPGFQGVMCCQRIWKAVSRSKSHTT
jgi:hypothetical protein